MASFSDQPAGAGVTLVARTHYRRDARDRLRALSRPRYTGALLVALPLVVFALLRFGAGGRFAVAAFFIASLCLLSAIDLGERRLPNRIVLPSAAVVLVAQTVLFPDRALEWWLASLGTSFLLLLLWFVYPEGLGMGDVKLALLLGAALGSAVLTALFLGAVAAAVYAVFLLARDGAEARKQTIPLGPFLAFGAIAVVLL
jgi:prepilin signal peptidase PulO-like enzyme (type II secretory pathway)